LTPRNNDQLLFDGLPWVARAQEEHDAFTDLLRSRGVEVLLLSELLIEALKSGAARMQGIGAAVDDRRLGLPLAHELSAYLRSLSSTALAHVLMAGMTFTELPPSAKMYRWSAACITVRTSSSSRCPTWYSPATRRSGSAPR
jgi:arginine deiminase